MSEAPETYESMSKIKLSEAPRGDQTNQNYRDSTNRQTQKQDFEVKKNGSRQAGRQAGRQAKTSWEASWETRGETSWQTS